MKENVGNTDRVVRFILGALLIYYAFVAEIRILIILASVFGGISLLESYTGFCGIYKLLNIDTNKRGK